MTEFVLREYTPSPAFGHVRRNAFDLAVGNT